MLNKFREPVNSLTHLGGAALAVPGVVILLFLAQGDPLKQALLLLYGASVVLMLLASGTYHMAKASPAAILRLRKFDHSAIYLLIAGTYTPVCYYYLQGGWRWSILGIVWGMALIGIVVKLFVINAPRWVTAGIYLVMGWLGVIAGKEIWLAMPAAALTWLVLGGIFYTVGALIYISKQPDPFPNVFGFHEIWHIFVLLGILSHYILIAAYIAGN